MNEDNVPEHGGGYVPDKRLSGVYREANELNDSGLQALCPSYSELSAVRDRYVDETPIGQGALKDVHKAYDSRTHRWVALARLRPDRGPDFYDLFVHEAWLVASLKHPNIIKVHDAGVDADGRPFFTMDLRSNTTLADLDIEARPDALNANLQTFVKICDAVAYAHSRGVVHLDLKPENIQTDAFGEVLVCDWGLGKLIEGTELEEDEGCCPVRAPNKMTLMGQIKGSLGYMAPEQVEPGTRKDQRTDIYALGCMLHFILTGHPPFTGSREEILADTAKSKVVSPMLKYPKRYVPESLDAVVMKATALAPADRYQSVERLQHEIERYLSGFATKAEQPGFFREARLFVARNRVPTFITVAALLTLGVMGVLFVQRVKAHRMATETERGRADQLSREVTLLGSEVETLDMEYTSYVEQTQEAKQKLARDLAFSARMLKDLAIYERPLATVREARRMATTALQQDPDCDEAHAQHVALDCIELNFKAALARPTSFESLAHFTGYIPLVRAFPELSFSRRSRPGVEELADFFREARLVSPGQAERLERALAYDRDVRERESGYTPVVEGYLQYMHGGPEHLTLSYDPETATLSLWSDRGVRLAGQFGNCLLRFLSFRCLELDIAGHFELADLNGQSIESLDLSRCRNVALDRPVSLPQLRKLLVHPGQLSPEALRLHVQANAPFEIVVIPPDS